MDNTNPYGSYLELLDSMRTGLEKLSALARRKTDTVRQDDLMALDEILKEEQALSLTFRGLEHKQETLLDETGLRGVPLSRVADAFPPSMRPQARQTVEALKNQYQIYRTCSEVARNTLEMNLHEIEKILSDLSGGPVGGPGYTSPEPEPPRKMKTDFRA